jgi:DNA-binding Lrp family transcriptional regulator
MVPFFVQIKCQLGQSYDVANKLADAELASEIYSTAGDFDLLVKFYVEDKTDIGHFVNEKVQTIPGIQDTRTIITFKAFCRSALSASATCRWAGLRRRACAADRVDARARSRTALLPR